MLTIRTKRPVNNTNAKKTWNKHAKVHSAANVLTSVPKTREEALNHLKTTDPWVLYTRQPLVNNPEGDVLSPIKWQLQLNDSGARFTAQYHPQSKISIGDILYGVCDNRLVGRWEVVEISATPQSIEVQAIDAIGVLALSNIAISIDNTINPKFRAWYCANRACVPFYIIDKTPIRTPPYNHSGIQQSAALQAIIPYMTPDVAIYDNYGVVYLSRKRLLSYILTSESTTDYTITETIQNDYVSRVTIDTSWEGKLLGTATISFYASELAYGISNTSFTTGEGPDGTPYYEWGRKAIISSRPKYKFTAKRVPGDWNVKPGDYIMVCVKIEGSNTHQFCGLEVTHIAFSDTDRFMDVDGILHASPHLKVLDVPDIFVDSVARNPIWSKTRTQELLKMMKPLTSMPPTASDIKLSSPYERAKQYL